MMLSGSQKKDLRQALMGAFEPAELDRVLKEEMELPQGISMVIGGGYDEVVGRIIDKLDAQGRTKELVRRARERNPGNEALREFVARHFRGDFAEDDLLRLIHAIGPARLGREVLLRCFEATRPPLVSLLLDADSDADDTLRSIVETVEVLPKRADGTSPLVAFATLVERQIDPASPAREDVRAWIVAVASRQAARPAAPAAAQTAAPLIVDASPRRVFLSYRRMGVDAALAERLRAELAAAGHSVFIDVGMSIGVDWPLEIRKNIAQSDYFVLLLSEESNASEMVHEEVRQAHRRHLAARKPKILPIRVKYDGPLYHELELYVGHLQHARWAEPADDRPLIAQLLEALRSARDGVASISDPPPSTYTVVDSTRDTRPAPTVDPRLLTAPGGAVLLRDPLYVQRACDKEAARLAQADVGQTLCIKGARQRGKSSLLMRFLADALQRGRRIALIDFQAFEGAEMDDYPDFLRSFSRALLDALDIDSPGPTISDHPGMTKMLRKLLKASRTRIVLAFDEVDRIMGRHYQAEFFALLRTWHNNRANPAQPEWEKLDLALVISTEPHLLIANVNMSPFNVAHTIRVDVLTLDECHALNSRYPTPLPDASVVILHELLGGHPYLMRLALYKHFVGNVPLQTLLDTATDTDGPFGEHLRAMWSKLSADAELLPAFRTIIGNRAVTKEIGYRLESAGLVRSHGNGHVASNVLYASFFRSIK